MKEIQGGRHIWEQMVTPTAVSKDAGGHIYLIEAGGHIYMMCFWVIVRSQAFYSIHHYGYALRSKPFL